MSKTTDKSGVSRGGSTVTVKPSIFSDIDGTVCFHAEAHGVCELRRELDGICEVVDPASGRVYRAFDVSASSYSVYLAHETRSMFHRLRRTYNIVLVTGARLKTMKSRIEALDFADWIILENGGMIVNGCLEIEDDWRGYLESAVKVLPEVARNIRKQGWKLDVEGRTSAIRVRLRDNPGRSAEEFVVFCDSLRLPSGVKTTRNLNNLDIIPERSGKANAVRYLTKSRGLDSTATIGIGDDINDLEFLDLMNRVYVPASSYPEVLRHARERNWTVSQSPTFDGIHEILHQILALAPRH